MRTKFSPVNKFRQGQYVTAGGRKGIVQGWRRGRSGKVLIVKLTEGPKKGKLLAFNACHVAARRGNKGRGPLLRFA